MASRTQIRLAQLTGSLFDGENKVSVVNADSLQGSLDHLASAIKRIHGGSSFSNQDAGVFSTVDVSGGTLTLAAGQVAADKVGAGTFDAGTYSFASSTISDLGAVTTVDINGGTIDGATIATSDITVGAGKSLDVSAGTLTTSESQKLAILQGANSNIDVGAFDLRASTLTADSLSQGLVLYTGANGVLSAEAGFAYDADTDTLTVKNLIVDGTTTQVDTEILQVKDKNILINDGGTTAGSAGAGIDIEGDSAQVVGYMRVGSSDNSNLEFKAPGNAGILTVDINATKTLTVAGALNIEDDSAINQDVTTDASVTFGSVTVDNILINGTEIDLSSGDLTLDVAGDIVLDAAGSDVLFHKDGTLYGGVNMDAGAGVTLSSDNLKGLGLKSGQGAVAFKNNAGNSYGKFTDGGNGGKLMGVRSNSGTAQLELALEEFGKAPEVKLQLQSNGVHMLSGSLDVKNGASAASIKLWDAEMSNGFSLIAPSLSDDRSITLPSNAPQAGYVLVTDGSGVTSWSDLSVGSNTKKAIKVVDSSGTSVNIGTVEADSQAITNLNDFLGKQNQVDVFVNGQMMTTGSVAQISGATRDYRITSATELNFSFGLEIDDVVQVITRG